MQSTGQRNDPRSHVTPYLTVSDGPAAIAFYERAFGAKETYRMTADDGRRILHSQLEINGGMMFLSDHFSEMAGGAPAPVPAGMTLHLGVDDADACWSRALSAGATVVHPIADQFWGDRWGVFKDPFGHDWSVGSPLKK